MDATLDMMKRRGIPETRGNYLTLAYMGNPELVVADRTHRASLYGGHPDIPQGD